MLSAKSNDGKIWISGCIHNPKSRGYHCVNCEEKVSYVSPHTRSERERVVEHFRHGKNATHPVRPMTSVKGEALEFILRNLSVQPEIEVFTDRIYKTQRGDIATDILAREYSLDGNYIDTLIMVEDSNKTFNFNDHLVLQQTLSANGIYLMTVLCAERRFKLGGAFYRDEFRKASGQTVKELFKNEWALYDWYGVGTYFDHDASKLLTVKLQNYTEVVPENIFGKRRNEFGNLVSTEYVVARAGDTRTFELKKTPIVREELSGEFKFKRGIVNGRLLAIPRPLSNEDYSNRELIKNREEQMGLEGLSLSPIEELTQQAQDYFGVEPEEAYDALFPDQGSDD